MARRRPRADPSYALQEVAQAYGALRVAESVGAPYLAAFAGAAADALAEACGEPNLVEALIPHEPLSAIAQRVEALLSSFGAEAEAEA